jgi:TetR/AcrR family tetracycline transcriptional repressor
MVRRRVRGIAVALLDAEGLDGVTTRKLAARLGVQSPTLYWHVPNKAALVTAILDQEFGDMSPPEPQQHWQDWLGELAGRLRRTLLAHPDGARVVSAAQLSTTMAAIADYFSPGRTVDDLFRDCLDVVIAGAAIKAAATA